MHLARLIAVFSFLLLVPHMVAAHAEFRGSDPSAQAILTAPPTSVVLRFSEPVSPLVISFVESGEAATGLSGESRNETVVIDLPSDLSEGTHLLSWRVMSVDGHPIGGTLVFSVGHETAGRDLDAKVPGTAWFAAASRGVLSLFLVLGVGATVFLAVVNASGRTIPASRRFAVACCALVLPAAVATVSAQGADMLGLASLWPSGSALRAGAVSPTGLTSILAVAAALTALCGLSAVGKPVSKWLAVLAWMLAATSFAASGHATTADPRWLATPAVALHAASLIYWLGALLPLLFALRSEPGALLVVHRFSRLAVPLVAVLVASGAILTVLQAGSVDALLESDYGIVLAVKLTLVAAMLGLAARNRIKLTPALTDGFPAAAAQLRYAVLLELALGILVLAMASGFRLTPPPRSTVEAVATEEVTLTGQTISGILKVSPGRVGVNDILAVLEDDEGPLNAIGLTFSLSQPGIEPIRIPAHEMQPGEWMAGNVNVPLAGEWTIEVQVLVSDFAKETIPSVLTID
ncbi:MAG: CopD family protein [Silicimonas sp.]|nr:CopD family protein [Silicimonas sp.]